MNYHRWISLDGCYMSVVEVKAFKRHRFLWKIAHGIIRRITLWSALAAVTLFAHSTFV